MAQTSKNSRSTSQKGGGGKGNGSGGGRAKSAGSTRRPAGSGSKAKPSAPRSAPPAEKKDGKPKRALTERDIDLMVMEQTRNSSSSQIADRRRAYEEARRKHNYQIASIIVSAAAVLYFIIIVRPSVSQSAHNFIGGLFGSFGYNLIWLALIIGIAMVMAFKNEYEIKRISKYLIMSTFALTTFFSLKTVSDVITIYEGSQHSTLSIFQIHKIIRNLYVNGRNGSGAGVFGGLISALLSIIFGKSLARVLVVLAIFVIAMLMFDYSIPKLMDKLVQIGNSISDAILRVLGLDPVYAEPQDKDDEEEEEFSGEDEPEDSPEDTLPAIHIKPELEIVDPDTLNSEKRNARHKKTSFIYDPDTPEENSRKEEKEREGILAEREAAEKKAEEEKEKLDELIERAASKKSKKEQAVEIARNAVELGSEIDQTLDSPELAYKYPPVELLKKPDDYSEQGMREELSHNAERLVTTLRQYGVEASVTDISRGPAVTRYELMPAPGVKISKITSLTNDIALRLAAKSVRIEAPIPGKPAVGVEIPNQKVNIVRVRELIDSPQFREAKSPVTVCIGRDIEGQIVLADLSRMPHLLIAGSTGSGKSVCMNSMLISMIYKSSPEDLRLILIDPKAVELDIYNGIPHLLVPVVCEPKKAAGALQWAVSEMLKRYQLLKENSVRNIDGYNRLAENNPEMKKLSRIVIVIDEMADLMVSTPKEVEDAISRLAAMARAAGMHMVLATQRPSVDVITGTIKNNIPSRIAFAVSSQVDSRTILDESGAEGLIGYGDMLFNPVGAQKPRRVQGCLVEDGEVEAVVSFIKQNGEADYDEQIAQEIERKAAESGGQSEDDPDLGEVDVLFNKAVECVIEAGQASTAMIQRRLGVGYARAGRLIDQLEQRGVIGGYEGSKPRQVLMTRQQFLEMTMNADIPEGAMDMPEVAADQTELYLPEDDDDEVPF